MRGVHGAGGSTRFWFEEKMKGRGGRTARCPRELASSTLRAAHALPRPAAPRPCGEPLARAGPTETRLSRPMRRMGRKRRKGRAIAQEGAAREGNAPAAAAAPVLETSSIAPPRRDLHRRPSSALPPSPPRLPPGLFIARPPPSCSRPPPPRTPTISTTSVIDEGEGESVGGVWRRAGARQQGPPTAAPPPHPDDGALAADNAFTATTDW